MDDDQTYARIERVLGCKRREIHDLDETADGLVVTLRDGHCRLIDDGDTVWWYGEAPNDGLPLWPAVDEYVMPLTIDGDEADIQSWVETRTSGTTDGVTVPPLTTSSAVSGDTTATDEDLNDGIEDDDTDSTGEEDTEDEASDDESEDDDADDDDSTPPTGPAKKILEWVHNGDVAERAKAALVAERERPGVPRAGLVADLTKLAGE